VPFPSVAEIADVLNPPLVFEDSRPPRLLSRHCSVRPGSCSAAVAWGAITQVREVTVAEGPDQFRAARFRPVQHNIFRAESSPQIFVHAGMR